MRVEDVGCQLPFVLLEFSVVFEETAKPIESFRTLDQDPEFFNQYHHLGEANNLSNVRFLRYPPVPEGVERQYI